MRVSDGPFEGPASCPPSPWPPDSLAPVKRTRGGGNALVGQAFNGLRIGKSTLSRRAFADGLSERSKATLLRSEISLLGKIQAEGDCNVNRIERLGIGPQGKFLLVLNFTETMTRSGLRRLIKRGTPLNNSSVTRFERLPPKR